MGAGGRRQSGFGGRGGAVQGTGAASGRGGEGGAVQGAGATSGSPSARVAPAVLVVLDASLSMLDRQVWNPTYEALTGPGGPLEEFQDQVRFGLATYRGTARTTEDDPACAEMSRVGFAPRNLSAVRETYEEVGSAPRRLWETPTAHALTRSMELFATEAATTVRSVVLISDGAPDTCATRTEQCGQDRAIAAVQSAARAGIVTYPIGIGFGDEYGGCSPDTARCGADHFQDLANAGLGLPVVAPPAGYAQRPCVADETGGMLLASYAPEGGSAPLYWTSSPADVADALRKVLRSILARSP